VNTCPSCRRENADGARFCTTCGSALAEPCAQCGAELPAGAAFCPACGAPSAGLPRHGEERKVVTVLFADLVDSTGHAERLDPEDLRRLLSPYFRRVRAEVERFGGTVEKFIGDAVMAVFGAPVLHEDDPERAVRAALAVRDAVAELNEQTDAVDLHVRVAVNTGEAVVDLDAGEGEGMVSGDVVNTASRLENVAPVDGILVGETTYRASAGAIEYREVEPVTAKGKREPVPAWEAVRPSDGAARPTTPLVGRWQELSQVLDALVRVREERTPQLVSLVGVPGIGKTRLARELVSAVEAEPDFASWLVGRCLPYGDGVSFAALGEMARTAAGILTTDPADQAQAKLRFTLAGLLSDQDARWLEGHLAPLVGLGGETGSREDSFPAWRRFFEALAERGPLVLVFEDLHWADPAVLDFVDHLVDWASGVPLLVVCTARPELLERRPGWGGGKRNAITLSLSPLSDEDTGELVRSLLAQSRLPAELEAPLLAHAEGNPLYAEEYARMLVERGFLVRENGSWRLGATDLPLPETVQATIAARIDALPRDEKAVLQDAAVAGKVFWLGAVGREGVERLLHALERKEFVRRDRRSSVAGEVQYVFRHALVRDVAYGQIPRARRADAHLAAAAWLESLAGAGEDQVEQLAHHYLCALELRQALGEDTKPLTGEAARALHRAGERALSLNAYQAAARFFAAELEQLAPDAPERPYALLGLGDARGHAEGSGVDELEQALDGVLAAGDTETAAGIASSLGPLLWSRGEAVRAAEYMRRAAELIEQTPPSPAKAVVLSRLASLLSVRDEADEAIRLARASLELAEQFGEQEARARAYGAIANARTQRGDWGGFDDFDRSLAGAAELGWPNAVITYINYAGSKIAYGDLAGALELQARGRELAEQLGEGRTGAWLRAERVSEHYWAGRWDDAVALAEEVTAAPADGPLGYMAVPARLVRGHIRLDRGDSAGAADDSERALERALEIGDFQVVVPANAFRAQVLLNEDRAGEAADLVRAALELLPGKEVWASYSWADLARVLDACGLPFPECEAWSRWIAAAQAFVAGDLEGAAAAYDEIGSRPDATLARLRGAESSLASGRREEAKAQLEPALAFYGEVGATARLAEAEALLASA
jgi:class 3 adenylate cyclase/tetratricopeptide (TPR) repeat protein